MQCPTPTTTVYNTYLHVSAVPCFMKTVYNTYRESVQHLPPHCHSPTLHANSLYNTYLHISIVPRFTQTVSVQHLPPHYHCPTFHANSLYNTHLHISVVPCFTETVQDRLLEIGSAGSLPRTRHNEDSKHLNQHALVNAGTILACTAKSNKPFS